MQRKSISRLCMFFVLAATAAFTLGGCSDGKDGAAGKNGVDVTTGTIDASKFTTDDLKNIALDGKIISASTAGDKPVVEFQVLTKASRKGISGLRSFSLHIAQLKPEAGGSNSYWQNYISDGLPLTAIPAYTERGATVQTTPVNPSADAVTVFNTDGTVKAQGYTIVDHADGTYTVTFGANIKANTKVLYDATLTHRVAIGVRDVKVPGVVGKTDGAYAGPIDPLTGSVMAAFTNTNGAALVYDFVPSTGAMLTDASGKQAFARDIVTIAACNQCHYKLEYGSNNTSGHFGSRPDTKLCVICHTPQLEGGTGDFTSFMHKIHMGEELPTVATDTFPGGFLVAEIKFPQDQRNCTICHKGADVDNWKTKPAIKACGSCHSGIDFAAGTGTTNSGLTTGHSAGAKADGSCILCHNETTLPVAHATNSSTPNNTTTPAGLANFTYAISKVEVNTTTKQAEITFQISKDGTPVTFNTYDATVTGLVPITGFSSGPSFYVVYSVPQDGITAPADFNVSTSVSLTNLWNGLQGTLAVVDAATGSYKATLVNTAASAAVVGSATKKAVPAQPAYPITIPTAAKMVTGSMIGSFTQTTVTPSLARPALQVSKVATGFTARRAIVSNAKCNTCHEQLGIKPSFHGGARNDATACAFCHNPNRTSSGWSADSSTFIHAIHGASKRSTDFNWQSSLKYWTVGYPGLLKNCEACHLTGTYDFSATPSSAAVPNLLPITVATSGSWVINLTTAVRPLAVLPAQDTYYNIGDIRDNQTNGSFAFLVDASSSPYVSATNYGPGFNFLQGANTTFPAATTTLVNSPISSACYSCHDTGAAKAHMVQNGGAIYEARSTALLKSEACLVCHGAISSTNISNATAPSIKGVHRWW